MHMLYKGGLNALRHSLPVDLSGDADIRSGSAKRLNFVYKR